MKILIIFAYWYLFHTFVAEAPNAMFVKVRSEAAPWFGGSAVGCAFIVNNTSEYEVKMADAVPTITTVGRDILWPSSICLKTVLL